MQSCVGRRARRPRCKSRIAAVEGGLVSPVRIKGRAPAKLAERMQALGAPGVSVAVINNYQVEWAKAYGVADASTQSPATTSTRFQAASMSKPIACMAVLTLVEQGKLDLDRDVNAQLKSWQVPENEFTRQHAVDLRGIMSHTAGLTVHGFPGYAAGAPLPTVPEILDGKKPANTPAVRVDKVPGKGFRYSGGGTTLMQLLTCDVTGRPFPEFMRDTVLAPLAMTQSTYQQPLPADLQSVAASAPRPPGQTDRGPLARLSRDGTRRAVDHPQRRGPLRDRSPTGPRGAVGQGAQARHDRSHVDAAKRRAGRPRAVSA